MNANRTSGCEHPCKSAGRMFLNFSVNSKSPLGQDRTAAGGGIMSLKRPAAGGELHTKIRRTDMRMLLAEDEKESTRSSVYT